MATAPCISPQRSTEFLRAIRFDAPDSTSIPFQVSADDITEENITTSALFTYPCCVGEASGHALCLHRGLPLPATPCYAPAPEGEVFASEQMARAVRFLVGNLTTPQPSYDFDDPEAARVRALVQRGFALWNEGFFGNIVLYLAEVGGVCPGISPEQLGSDAFAGPWNTWDAQGMAQVALWFLLGQFPPDGKLIFLDGADNVLNTENQFRLFNGYTMMHLMAQAYGRGELSCEGDAAECSLSFAAPQSSFTLPPSAEESTVGPFTLNGCAGVPARFSLSAGVATSDAAGQNEIAGTPRYGEPFWLRVQPKSEPQRITMQAAAQAENTYPSVEYYQQAGAPTMALVRAADEAQSLQAQHTITIVPLNEEETDEPPSCVFIPQPFPVAVPCASMPRGVTNNNNNNNNSSNNNNNNNNNAVNQLLQNMQTQMVMQFLQRQQQPQMMPMPLQMPMPQPMPCWQPQAMPMGMPMPWG